jgi:RNAse (barnase) inhibitor barstar
VVEMVSGLFKSKPEKDLNKIVEKIGITSDRFIKASENLISVSHQTISIFEEIRKELKETNAHSQDYVKKLDGLQPIGLTDVATKLDIIIDKLDEINGNIKFSGMYSEPFQNVIYDIKDEIRSLKDEIRYCNF